MLDDRQERLRGSVEQAEGGLPCRVDTLLHDFGVSGYRTDREALRRGLEKAGLKATPDVTEAAADQVVVLRISGPAPPVARGPGPVAAPGPTAAGAYGGLPSILSGDSPWSVVLSVAGFLVACLLIGYGFGRLGGDSEADASRARDEAALLSTRAAARPAYAAAVKRGRARGRARGAREGRSRGGQAGAQRGRLQAIAAPVPPPTPAPPALRRLPVRPPIRPPIRPAVPPAVPPTTVPPTTAPPTSAPPAAPQTGTGR